MREYDQYIPTLWVMCLESVAHLLVMVNVSSNFLIYCSISSPFKVALSKVGGAISTHFVNTPALLSINLDPHHCNKPADSPSQTLTDPLPQVCRMICRRSRADSLSPASRETELPLTPDGQGEEEEDEEEVKVVEKPVKEVKAVKEKEAKMDDRMVTEVKLEGRAVVLVEGEQEAREEEMMVSRV